MLVYGWMRAATGSAPLTEVMSNLGGEGDFLAISQITVGMYENPGCGAH